jgi:hypothetical protein
MPEFIFLMHSDVQDRGIANDGQRWGEYFRKLRAAGGFNGGSSIGSGVQLRKGAAPVPANRAIEGFIRVEAESIEAVQSLVDGNPNYEAGGTVEVRELPQGE